MITDGRRYLRRDTYGNYVPTKNKILGDVWEQRSKAKNILMNCISKNFRKRYKVIEVEDNITSLKFSDDNSELEIEPKDSVVKQICNEKNEGGHLDSLVADIYNLTDFAQNTENRKETLLSALSDVDKEICDINHYIEFGKNFNAYQGWLAFNMLRSRLKKRRKIKDEIYIITQLGECKVNSDMLSTVKNSINGLRIRDYHPRKLKELFK